MKPFLHIFTPYDKEIHKLPINGIGILTFSPQDFIDVIQTQSGFKASFVCTLEHTPLNEELNLSLVSALNDSRYLKTVLGKPILIPKGLAQQEGQKNEFSDHQICWVETNNLTNVSEYNSDELLDLEMKAMQFFPERIHWCTSEKIITDPLFYSFFNSQPHAYKFKDIIEKMTEEVVWNSTQNDVLNQSLLVLKTEYKKELNWYIKELEKIKDYNHENYEKLPRWYKKIGKLLRGFLS